MPRAPVGREAMLRGLIEKKASLLVDGKKIPVPELQLPDVQGLKVEVPPAPPIDEADVVLAFQELRREHARVQERRPGEPVALGDEVELDFIAYHEGRVVPFSVREGLLYVLGEDLFWPGLSEGLVGTPVGEGRELELKLPDDHWVQAWRGRTVHAAVTVRAARKIDKPAEDDPAFLKATGRGETLEEVTTSLARDLLEDREQERLDFARDTVLDAVLARSELQVPMELVDEEIRQRFRRAEGDIMRRWGLSTEEQNEALEGWLNDPLTFQDAQRRVAIALLLGAWVKEHALEVTDEDVADFVAATAEELGANAEEVSALLGKGSKDEETLRQQLLHLIAVEDVVARVEVDLIESDAAAE